MHVYIYIYIYISVLRRINFFLLESLSIWFESIILIRVNNRLTRLFLDSKIRIRIYTIQVQNDSNDSITRNWVQNRVKWLDYCTRVRPLEIYIGGFWGWFFSFSSSSSSSFPLLFLLFLFFFLFFAQFCSSAVLQFASCIWINNLRSAEITSFLD